MQDHLNRNDSLLWDVPFLGKFGNGAFRIEYRLSASAFRYYLFSGIRLIIGVYMNSHFSIWLTGLATCFLIIGCDDSLNSTGDEPLNTEGSSVISSSTESSYAETSSESTSSSGALLNTVSSSSSIVSCTNTYGTNTVTDCRDEQTYNIVVIGTQTWMAENLAYLPSVNIEEDSATTVPKYYIYDYDGTRVDSAKVTSNYLTYGVLYNWAAANSACPSDWHLPTIDDWNTLENYVGGYTKAGRYLKVTTWDSYSGYPNLDFYGFSALPGGRYDGTAFSALGAGYWWTGTEYSSSRAYFRFMGTDPTVYNVDTDKFYGFSVRCLEDSE